MITFWVQSGAGHRLDQIYSYTRETWGGAQAERYIRGKTEAAMRITSKGPVTIPQAVRERAGLMPGADVEFEIDGAAVRLVKAGPSRQRKTRGQKLVGRMRGQGDFRMTTDEILALMRGPAADEELPPSR